VIITTRKRLTLEQRDTLAGLVATTHEWTRELCACAPLCACPCHRRGLARVCDFGCPCVCHDPAQAREPIDAVFY
jgi:hypothetical protein